MWGGLPVRMLRFTPVRLHRTVRITFRVRESVSSRVRARLCRNRNQSAEPLETDHELRTLQVRDDTPHGRASFDFCSPDRPTRTGVFHSGRWQRVNVHVHSVNADVLTFRSFRLAGIFTQRKMACLRKMAFPGGSLLLWANFKKCIRPMFCCVKCIKVAYIYRMATTPTGLWMEM